MSRIYRMHIRPSGGLGNPAASVKHCLDRQVLGLGWALPDPAGRQLTWEQYLEGATAEYGSRKALSRVMYLHDRIEPGDLIWTRDLEGTYYLARVKESWRYDDNQDASDADIVNVVPCEIHAAGLVDAIPGKVVACFRPSRTIQGIADPTVEWYSQLRWNELTARTDYDVPLGTPDLLTLIGDHALEDLVLLRLQTQGWFVLNSAREKDTLAYETVLVNPNGFARAVVQVKSGEETLIPARWANHDGQVFLFQANSRYIGAFPPNVTPIDAGELRRFAHENPRLLPAHVARWMKYLSEVHGSASNLTAEVQ